MSRLLSVHRYLFKTGIGNPIQRRTICRLSKFQRVWRFSFATCHVILSLSIFWLVMCNYVLRQCSSRALCYVGSTIIYLPKSFTCRPRCRSLASDTSNRTVHVSSTLRHMSHKFSACYKSIRWVPISLSFGLVLVAYQQYKRVLRRKCAAYAEVTDISGVTKEINNLQLPVDFSSHNRVVALANHTSLVVFVYRLIPWRTISRVLGWAFCLPIPEWARPLIIGGYAQYFGCNLNEASDSNVRNYPNLGEFFRRSLKPDARQIDFNSRLVSPVDGTVLSVGRCDSNCRHPRVEQVKGISYDMRRFLGSNPTLAGPTTTYSMSRHGDTRLHYCVIYLAPGDYHRFHSPADWTVTERRHFPGDLMSVSPVLARAIPDLLCVNERVVYSGFWRLNYQSDDCHGERDSFHGKSDGCHGDNLMFSLTAVGATNVGCVRVYCDEDLKTNRSEFVANSCDIKRLKRTPSSGNEANYTSERSSHDNGIAFGRGDMFGEFNFGSTVVLIFEAPADFLFRVHEGSRVTMGESLCHASC